MELQVFFFCFSFFFSHFPKEDSVFRSGLFSALAAKMMVGEVEVKERPRPSPDYLMQLLNEKKLMTSLPNLCGIFTHLERLLDEGKWRSGTMWDTQGRGGALLRRSPVLARLSWTTLLHNTLLYTRYYPPWQTWWHLQLPSVNTTHQKQEIQHLLQ